MKLLRNGGFWRLLITVVIVVGATALILSKLYQDQRASDKRAANINSAAAIEARRDGCRRADLDRLRNAEGWNTAHERVAATNSTKPADVKAAAFYANLRDDLLRRVVDCTLAHPARGRLPKAVTAIDFIKDNQLVPGALPLPKVPRRK